MTAEEFLKNSKNVNYNKIKDVVTLHFIEQDLIEFTKLHVEKCKEEIADNYLYYLEGDEGSERLNKKKFEKRSLSFIFN